MNYVQYVGVALSGVTADSTSSYFLFRPNLVPSATLRCRLIANSAAATAAIGLSPNQAVTVNALTRTDMGFVSSQIASMIAGQTATFPRTVELIVLGLPGLSSAQRQLLRSATATPTPLRNRQLLLQRLRNTALPLLRRLRRRQHQRR